jgi:peptide/nickel transport system permease protein
VFRFLLRRLGQTLAVLVTVSVIVFFVIRLIPGDPVMTMLGNEYTEQAYRDLRDKLGLDRPIAVQYAMWLRDLARGDLGYSNLLHGRCGSWCTTPSCPRCPSCSPRCWWGS